MASEELRFIPFREQDNRLVPLVALLAITLLGLWIVFGVIYNASVVDGISMMNTLHSGDRLLITRTYSEPTRGDIVSAEVIVKGRPDRVLKRVAAIAGDTVEVQGDDVWVNGDPATWPGVITGSFDDFHLGPFVIPEGQVYLLGDNRPESLDSRFIGPVSVSQIRGKAVAIFTPVTRIQRID